MTLSAEVVSKGDFLKFNSFQFIQNERFFTEQVHEKNAHTCATNGVRGMDGEEEIATRAQSRTISTSKMDFSGTNPKKYTTRCYIVPVSTPVWYTESLLLNIGSTKRKYDEKIYFKEKFRAVKWSETMTTEIKSSPTNVRSEIYIPVDDYTEGICYISLEPQQVSTDL